jgi:hypothetical protein
MATSPDDAGPGDEPRPEYDFRGLKGVVRGKYAARYRERLRVVRLADDVPRRLPPRRRSTRPCGSVLRGRAPEPTSA